MGECENCGEAYSLDDCNEDDGMCHPCAHELATSLAGVNEQLIECRAQLAEAQREREEALENLENEQRDGMMASETNLFRKRLATAVAELEWYADEETHKPAQSHADGWCRDGGDRARKALAEIRGKTEAPPDVATVPRGHCNRCDRCGWMLSEGIPPPLYEPTEKWPVTPVSDLLDRIAKALEGVTPGPWYVECESRGIGTKSTACASFPPSKEHLATLDDSEYVQNENATNDARFIVAARALLPEAAKELARKTAEVKLLTNTYAEELSQLRAELKVAREALTDIESVAGAHEDFMIRRLSADALAALTSREKETKT